MFVNCSVGLDENVAPKLSLYPNPANTLVTVQTGINALGTTYKLYDVLGRTMLSGTITTDNTILDISTLPSGIYVFALQGKTPASIKLIKE
jgi:hypothetical protein